MNQFDLSQQWYIDHTDFKDWTRYFYLFKTILKLKPTSILEIGAGNGVLKNALNYENYFTLDMNVNLNPDFVSDVREYRNYLYHKFDCIVCTEVLEHIPLSDVSKTVENLYLYLKSGHLLVMIPHKKPYISFSTPLNPTPIQITAPKFRNFKVVDPYHYWEVGLEGVKVNDIRKILEVNFKVVDYKYIPYHDYWVLEK